MSDSKDSNKVLNVLTKPTICALKKIPNIIIRGNLKNNQMFMMN